MRCRGGTVDFHPAWQEKIDIVSFFLMIEKIDITLHCTGKLLNELVNLTLLGSGEVVLQENKQTHAPWIN